MREKEVKSYKWVALKESAPKNAVLYILDPRSKEIELFITDKNGNPKPVKSHINIREYVKLGNNNAIRVEDGQIFVKKYNSDDGFIIVEETADDYKLRLNVDKIELLDNKQNSLETDGTGTKYPTVDAVNEVIQQVRQEIGEAGGDKNFVYDQPTPSSVWVIRHGLGKKVNVTIVDSANTVVIGQVTINDGNMVRIEFNASFTGQAILN